MATLIVFGGLPGTGKTAIAQEVAREVNAVYVRIDSIEQAIRASGALGRPIDDAGYRVAYVVAEDNLRIGRTVVADCVNPLQITRDSGSVWRRVPMQEPWRSRLYALIPSSIGSGGKQSPGHSRTETAQLGRGHFKGI